MKLALLAVGLALAASPAEYVAAPPMSASQPPPQTQWQSGLYTSRAHIVMKTT